MKSGQGISVVRVLVIASALGIGGGVGLSFWRQAQRERELEKLTETAERLPAALTPAPGELPRPSPEVGSVKLPSTDGLPQYPGAFVRPLMQTKKGEGAEMNIAWFATQDSVRDVLQFYSAKFAEKHLLYVAHQYSDHAGYVGYLGLDDDRMHLISVMRDHQATLVFPSSSLPEKLLDAAKAPVAPAGLPTIAGAEGNLAFDVGALNGGPRRLWLTRVPQRSLVSVLEQYKQDLATHGWNVEELPRATATEAVLNGQRDGSSIQVTLRRDASATVAVYVSLAPKQNVP